MSYTCFYRNLILFFISLSSLFFSLGTQAQETTTTVVEKHVVVTPAPKSVSCTTVSAHWEGDIWIDTQSVCTYANRTEGAAWVQDYWACTVFTADGNCNAWEYKPGHWVKTFP